MEKRILVVVSKLRRNVLYIGMQEGGGQTFGVSRGALQAQIKTTWLLLTLFHVCYIEPRWGFWDMNPDDYKRILNAKKALRRWVLGVALFQLQLKCSSRARKEDEDVSPEEMMSTLLSI